MKVKFSSASRNATEYYETIRIIDGLGRNARASIHPINGEIVGLYRPSSMPIVSHSTSAGGSLKNAANRVLMDTLVSM